jgi:glyoxylase-like metal-dependent hydrolase (beta-lactamase superfamily II)
MEANLPPETRAFRILLPYHLGRVNCYLIETGTGFILIDTGSSNKRTDLYKDLETAGCKPGNLNLILITHGDFDHTGNAAYLRTKFGAKIAMHEDDSGMAERADMFWNRKKGSFLIRMMAPILFGFGKSDKFKPDLFIGDGFNLNEYGLDARVLSIPGHSRGSIAILTAGKDLFCGDLLDNTDQPVLNSIIDDSAAAQTSVEKLLRLDINTVYPGHGDPFPMELFIKNCRSKDK